MEDTIKLPLDKWTEDQVSSWLHGIGVKEKYVSKLCDEEVDGPVLRDITEDYLINKIGMKSGQVFLILSNRDQLIQSIKKTQMVKVKPQQPTTKEISEGLKDAEEPQIGKETKSPFMVGKKILGNHKDVETPIQQHPIIANKTSANQKAAKPQPVQTQTPPEEETQGPSVVSKKILDSQKDASKTMRKRPTVVNETFDSPDIAEHKTNPVKDTAVMPFTKRDCKRRPFGKEGIHFTYIMSNVLQPETGISDLISPCHEYKSFAIAAKLNHTKLQAKFAREVLKFGTGCMNIRSNGTIHFGVMDSREDTGYIHGEIIGIPVLDKDIYVDALDHIERCYSRSDAEDVRRCIRPPEFIEVTDINTDEKRYVVEVDIVPQLSIVRNRVYTVRLPNFNEKSNKVIHEKVAIFCRVGATTKPVDDQNYFYQRVSTRDAQREAAENRECVTMPEACPDLGRKLTMLVTGGKTYLEKGKWFILVTNKFCSEHLSSIDFLLNMRIFCVFDFDPDSNLSGLCQEYLKHHAANLHFMHDYIISSSLTSEEFQKKMHLFEQTSWIFCNGRNDFKGKEQCDDMTWFKTKKTQLKECASLICKQILPKGTFTLIFLLTSPVEKPLLHTYSEFFSDMGGHEDIICISESEDNFEKWQSFAQSFCNESMVNHSSVVGMKISHVNATLQRIQSVASRTTKHLPTYAKGECLLESREEERMYSLEILYMDHCDETREDVIEAEKENIEQHFYHGGKVNWMNFWLAEKRHVGEVIQRDAYQVISNLLSDCLKNSADQLHIHSFNIFHHPGSGGSTVARQVLWNNRKKLRCAVVKPSYSAVIVSEHAYRLRTYEETGIQKCVPVLLLVEDCDDDFLGDLKNELENAITRQKITQGTLCFIVLSCRRSYNPEKKCKESPFYNVQVTHKLSKEEKKQFSGKRKMLEKQYNPEFILTFVLMSEGFDHQKISKYVQKFVEHLLQDIDHDHVVTRLIHYVALLNTYVQNSFLSQSHCEARLTLSLHLEKFQLLQGDVKEEFRQHAFEEALTEPGRLVFIHLRDERTYIKSIRIIHPLVAKEILKQLLCQEKQESELALELLNDDVLYEHRFGREDYVKCLRALFMRRDRISKGDEEDSFFSPLIEHVRDTESPETAVNLLKEAYKRFDKDPLFAQHLARLNYSQEKFEDAECWAELAGKKLPNNPFILNTKGQVYRKWFYKKVSGLKKENKTAERIADAVRTAIKAMDSFQECQRAAIADAESMSNAGFFAAAEVGCRLLQLFSTSSVFTNKTECVKYLLTDHIPDKVKKPWEDFHSKLKDLYKIIQTSLEWISEDLSYFQTDPSADEEETEDQIKHPKKWLVRKSVEFGEYFSVHNAYSESGSDIPTPAMTRMKIYQLGGGNMTNIFSILTDSKRKDKVKVLEDLIYLYKLLREKMDQMDLVNYIASNITLSCLSTQSKALASLKELQDLSQKFPKDKRNCQPNALFLLTLLFWPEDHDSEEDKEKKYEFVLSAVKILTTCYFDKQKDIPARKRRIYTHFFLGNGKGLEKIVHKSKVLATTKSLPVSEKRIRWYHGEGWKMAETAKLLKLVSGRTENGSVYLEGPQKLEFMVTPLNAASVPYSNENVTFYLGFTMRGPVAFNVTIKNR
ncbi:sterile alpha motif domain-containing protein 9-like [Alosa alosa]|uniref:sterile alpha motif domain-containing protein 9-like n=1 Tax=Alosa alosa TaxID=278164 RepID=UPI00201512C2|nr:sterile alpha motif domain-containing protein 9-like [Alosa alosa]